jgi:hypothetical protein
MRVMESVRCDTQDGHMEPKGAYYSDRPVARTCVTLISNHPYIPYLGILGTQQLAFSCLEPHPWAAMQQVLNYLPT